jgi:hypothetical protein
MKAIISGPEAIGGRRLLPATVTRQSNTVWIVPEEQTGSSIWVVRCSGPSCARRLDRGAVGLKSLNSHGSHSSMQSMCTRATPPWPCSIMLLRYFIDFSFVSFQISGTSRLRLRSRAGINDLGCDLLRKRIPAWRCTRIIDENAIRAGYAAIRAQLTERGRRLFAATEKAAAGYGGIAAGLGCQSALN